MHFHIATHAARYDGSSINGNSRHVALNSDAGWRAIYLQYGWHALDSKGQYAVQPLRHRADLWLDGGFVDDAARWQVMFFHDRSHGSIGEQSDE